MSAAAQVQLQPYDLIPHILQKELLPKSSNCGSACQPGTCPVIGSFMPNTMYAQTVIFRDPNETHRMYVIAEYPADDPERWWDSPQGKFLTSILHQQRPAGVSIAVGYMVKCRPSTVEMVGNKPRPKADHAGINHCTSNHLWAEIDAFNADSVLLLGATVAKTFLDPTQGMMDLRGKLFWRNLRGSQPERQIPVLATLAPETVARQPYQGAVVRVDIAKLMYWTRQSQETYNRWRQRAQVEIAPCSEEGLAWWEQLVENVINDDSITLAAWDTETESLSKSRNRLYSFGFAYHPDFAFAIDVEHPRSLWSPEQKLRIKASIRKLMECKRIDWIAHRAVFDLGIASITFGHRNRRTEYDTQAMAHALDEEFTSKEYEKVSPRYIMAWQGLEPQINHWLDFEDRGWENMKKHRKDLAALPVDKVNEYCALDCANTLRIFYPLAEALWTKSPSAFASISKIIKPINYVLSHIEESGIPIDNEEIRRQLDPTTEGGAEQYRMSLLKKFLDMPAVKELNRRLLAALPKRPLFGNKNLVNADSPDHMQILFYDILGHEEVEVFDKKSGTRVMKKPCDAAFLDRIVEEQEAGWEEATALKEYRQYTKLCGTFLTGFEENASRHHDNRVRASYQPTKTVTHRLSASDPNTQQIPRGGESKNAAKGFVKQVIKAPKGYALCGADYGTAEVRVGAIASNDDLLASTFNNSENLKANFLKKPMVEAFEKWKFEGDAHRQNAAAAYGVPIRQVSSEQRQGAKNVSFLCIYSANPAPQLAGKINTSVEEAQTVVDGFLGKFVKLRSYLSSRDVIAENFGLIHTPLGRTRSLYAAMFPDNKKEYQHAINQARNTGIQSSASDMLLLALYEVVLYIEDNNKDWRIINVVHDSVLALVPIEEVQEFGAILKAAMESPKIDQFGLDPSFCAMGCDLELGDRYSNQCSLDGTPRHFDRVMGWLTGGCNGDEPESRFAEYLSVLGKVEKMRAQKEKGELDDPAKLEALEAKLESIVAIINEEYPLAEAA